MRVLRERATVTWAVLVVATVVSTWFLAGHTLPAKVGVVGIFLLAAVKVWLVTQEFMELRTGPRGVRVAAGVWIVVVVAVILGFWFTAPSP